MKRLTAMTAHGVALLATTFILIPIGLALRAANAPEPSVDSGFSAVAHALVAQASQDPDALRPWLNGLLLSAGVALVCFFVGPGAGHALSLPRLPFRRGWTGVLWLMALAPVTMILVPSDLLLSAVNLRNSIPAAAFVELATALPLTICIMTRAFGRVPAELLEAARLEGASPYQVYRLVALPLVRDARVAAFAAVFALTWGEYVISGTLLSRASDATLAGTLVASARSGVEPWGRLAAELLLASLPSVTLLVMVQWRLNKWVGVDQVFAGP
jgi:multiple sugar transport system permease protein